MGGAAGQCLVYTMHKAAALGVMIAGSFTTVTDHRRYQPPPAACISALSTHSSFHADFMKGTEWSTLDMGKSYTLLELQIILAYWCRLPEDLSAPLDLA